MIHEGTNRSKRQILPDRDLIGVIAEEAYAKLMGLSIDASISKTGDQGYDFLHPSGLKVDIKATKRPDGRLFVPLQSNHQADVYVLSLVDVNARQAWFLGWAYRHVVLNAPIKEYHGAKFYVLRQSKLNHMSILKT